eukprot:TRINITY_DN7071_c0_g2_i1.p1 TRINITY_DN7071_c0_g2~~TRINITY_DN7071_c0_g2_i1.p1  ORF type:complete len:540 (+),score=114.86 TRINITY_DN7071_c0_g2_i1:14-1633(+)
MATIFGFGEEVAVINNELLKAAVEEQAPEAVQVYGPESGAKDGDVKELRLDLRKILKIDNLWAFTSLRKLQLDNNLIERIENLDSLVHLEWLGKTLFLACHEFCYVCCDALDLSFNQIEVIEGLDKLVKLKDLTLHENRICKLEGLDTLTALEVLSIGNNKLASLEEAPLLYLRNFANLACLNAAGNPMCTDPRYESYTVAFLPTLKFLDYRRIATEIRNSALIKYQDQLEVVEAKEDAEAKTASANAAAKAKAQEYQEACITGLEGDSFFTVLLDPGIQSLSALPGVPEILGVFRDRLSQQINEFSAFALSKAQERKAERIQFEEAVRLGVQETNAAGSRLIDGFIDRKTEFLAQIEEDADLDPEALIEQLKQIKYELMDAEIDLVAQIEDTTGTFERTYVDMVSALKEQAQSTFADLRQMEEETLSEVNDIAMAYLDALAKGEEDRSIELSELAQEVLRDKPALEAAMAAAHDNHMLTIDNCEDNVTTAANNELKTLIDGYLETEAARNRNHVAEICNFYDYHFSDLQRVADQMEGL